MDEPEQIAPVYRSKRANQPVRLRRARLALHVKGHVYEFPATAALQAQPRLQLVLRADLSRQPDKLFRFLGANDEHLKVQYGSLAKPVPVFLLNSGGRLTGSGEKPFANFTPNPAALTLCKDRRTRLASVIFHVMNFPAFLSTGHNSQDLRYRQANGGIRLGRTVLEHEGWRIELQTLPEGTELVKQLRSSGGYAITHVGELKRGDGKSFRIAESEALLRELHLFLSFARGTWLPLILPVGFDGAGRRVFEDWGLGLGTAWQPCKTWFDEHHGEALPALYPGFVDLIRDPMLGKAAKNALYWYLRSNRAGDGAGVDSGIILSQAALERLSVAYLAKHGHPTNGRAADLMREALRQLRLPVSIPDAVPAIRTGKRKSLWSDLPEALAKVRNELVHPRPKLGIKVGTVVPSVWNFAQWHIELFILRLSGYQGVYSNRLRARWRGQVESVPWNNRGRR